MGKRTKRYGALLNYPRPHGELVEPRGRSHGMSFTIYILECSDGSYYTGLTRKPVEERLWEHNAGVVDGYTHSRRPVMLRFVESTESAWEAISRERQIKGWTRRKKEALMSGHYEALPGLSKSKM